MPHIVINPQAINRHARRGLAALDQIEARMARLGLVEGQPDHIDNATLRIDEEAWAAAECPECGAAGLGITPYHALDREEYRLVAVCPACLWADEA